MKIGMIGYGKAGSAVASILQQDPRYQLEWIATRTGMPQVVGLGGRDVPVIALHPASFGDWIDAHPVDALVDFLQCHVGGGVW
jgi:4-hydroxy-tetrahydrodipicolinate reductase